MATITTETLASAVPVLDEEETKRFDAILEEPVEPIDPKTAALFGAALSIQAD